MNPALTSLLIGVVKNAFTKDNVVKSPTTWLAILYGGIATASASKGYTLSSYSSEHEMWVAVGTAILSGILFFINDRAKK